MNNVHIGKTTSRSIDYFSCLRYCCIILLLLAGAVVANVSTAFAVDDIKIRKDKYTTNGYEVLRDGVVTERLKENEYLPEGYYDLYDNYGRKQDSLEFDYDDGYGDGYDSWGGDE